jgi:two-component system nitrogen regulation response regulator NtrX
MVDVLIIDDKIEIRELISEILEDEGYKVACAHDFSSANAIFMSNQPKVVILDIWLEGSEMDGIGLLQLIKKELPCSQVLMISGHADISLATKTIKYGAYDFIEKPFKSVRLLTMVKRAMDTYSLLDQNHNLLSNDHTKEIIGENKKILKIKSLINSIGPKQQSRALIKGDSGVGKSTIARIIHNKSPRADKPFVYWHTSNKSRDTLFSELLGNENNRSIFSKADKGTLFINDILYLPLDVQATLLQILKSGVIESKYISTNFNVRLITATRSDPITALEKGTLSETLYYEISSTEIYVPNLNERKEDIPLLFKSFIENFASSFGEKTEKIDQEVINYIKLINFPGNVRQLRNLAESLIISARAHCKNAISLDLISSSAPANTTLSMQSSFIDNFLGKPIKEARDIFEKKYIEIQLEKFNQDISKTAEFIGMNRAALYRKIKSLN